jgi:chromosome segregation ATPase
VGLSRDEVGSGGGRGQRVASRHGDRKRHHPEGHHRRYHTEAATWDAAHTSAQEKTVLEAKVAELEQELVTTGVDLRMVNWQFTEVTKKLQEVTDEASRLRVDNSKLLQDVNGKARCLQLRTLLTTRNVAICDDLLVTPLTFVIEWYVICDEISIFVIGAK